MAIREGVNSAWCCLIMQEMASEVHKANDPAAKELEAFGIYWALNSPANLSNFETLSERTRSREGKELPSNNRRRVTLAIEPKQRYTVNNGFGQPCTAGTVDNDRFQYVDLDVTQEFNVKFSIDKSEFRALCEGRGERMARRQNQALQSLMSGCNTYFADQLVQMPGEYFPSGTNSLTTPKQLFLFDSNDRYNGRAFFPVRNHFNRAGYGDIAPITIGGSMLDLYRYGLPTILNRDDSGDGRDVNQTVGNQLDNLFIDYTLDTAMAAVDVNADNVMTMVPGHVQPLYWYRYEPGTDFEELDSSKDYTRTQLVATVRNLFGQAVPFTVDLAIEYNHCGGADEEGQFTFVYSKVVDTYRVPPTYLTTGANPVGGQEGILRWRAGYGDPNQAYYLT